MDQKSNFDQLQKAQTNNEVAWKKCHKSQGDEIEVQLDENDGQVIGSGLGRQFNQA